MQGLNIGNDLCDLQAAFCQGKFGNTTPQICQTQDFQRTTTQLAAVHVGSHSITIDVDRRPHLIRRLLIETHKLIEPRHMDSSRPDEMCADSSGLENNLVDRCVQSTTFRVGLHPA